MGSDFAQRAHAVVTNKSSAGPLTTLLFLEAGLDGLAGQPDVESVSALAMKKDDVDGVVTIFVRLEFASDASDAGDPT